MKKLLLLMLTFMLGFGSWQTSAQETLTVADGTTTNSYVPVYGLWLDNYTRAQVVYPETMLTNMMGGAISELTFYFSSSPSSPGNWTSNFEVRLGTAAATTLSAFLPAPTDIVYSGTFDASTNLLTITFSTPYVFTGGNLLLEISSTTTGGYSSGYFYGISSTGSSLSGYSSSGVSSVSPTQRDFIPKTTFSYSTGSTSCGSTGNVVVSNITAYNADIAWGMPADAGSYILQYKTSDLDWTDIGVETDYPTDTTYSFSTPLIPNTNYNVRVANICTSGDTSFWRSVSFKTACAPVATLPLTENFDNYGTGGASNYPDCWTKLSTYTSGTSPYITSTNYQGTGSLYFYVGSATQYNMAIMPSIDPINPINTLQASFVYRASNATDRLIVGVMDDFTDATTFTPVDTVYPVVGSASTWDERVVTFDQYTGSGTYIAFKNEYTSTYAYAYIDNLTVDVIATCQKPTDVTITNYTTVGADINWAPGGNESSWEVVAVPAGQDVNTGTPEPATSYPYTLTNLQSNTTYDVYVRSDCGSGEYSGWTLKRTFTTNLECSSPLHVNVGQITTNSALVTWDNAIFGASGYTVGYSEAGQGNWTTQVVNDNQFMISGLTINSSYDVYVGSNCSLGHADSVTVNFHTRACIVGGDLEIGDGTSTSSYLPDYTFYNYAYMEEIYLASEMNGPAVLNSIAFNASSVSTPTRTIKLYLMHTSSAGGGSSWLNPSSAQLVYDNSITWTTGWNTINFSTPFQYNGMDNLAVILVDETGSYNSSNSFLCHTTSTSMARYVYNDGSAYTLPPTASGTTTTYRNNVIFGVPCDSTTTCAAPNVYVASTTDNSATVAWVPGNTETSWELEYHTEADTNWVSAGSVTSPYTITSLSSNLNVFVRVRANCGGGETSSWAVASGRTRCSVVNTLPLEEHFDNPTSTGPENMTYCWSTITNSSSSYPALSTSYANSGNYSVYFYGTSAYFSYLVSPEIDASIAINSLQVRFWGYKTSPTYYIQVGVMTDPNDYSTFTQVGGDLSPDTINNWRFLDINLDNYSGNGHYIAFRIPQSYASYMYVDDIAIDIIPTCAHIDSLHVSDMQATGATFDWVPGGSESAWDVAIVPGTGDVDFDTVNIITVTGSPSLTVNDLEQNTIYTVYVRANCGNDQSFWMSAEFMTTQVPATLPYYCDFENAEQASGFAFVNGSQPHKWCVGTATSNGGTHAMYISGDNGATNSYSISSTSNTWAYRDIEFPASPSGYTLTFDWRGYGESCCDYMRVFVGSPVPVTAGSLDQPAGSTSMVPNYNSSYANYFNTSSSYHTFTATLPGMTETTVKRIYFLWHNDGSVGDNPPAAVDNISIDIINCDAPTALTVDSTSTTTADISWTTTATSSVISYRGDNDADWTEIPSVTSPYQLTNLAANTHYTVRVANNCDDGVSTSPYVTISFFTDCDVINTLPYTENFDSYTASTTSRPNCWSFPITYSNAPYITSSYNSSSPNSLYFQSATATPTTAVTPQFGADIHTLRVKFMLKAESTTSSGTFEVGVMSDPTDVTTFESVRIIQPVNTSWNQYVVDFDSTTMTGTDRYIAFRQNSNSSVYYYWLDNVLVMNIPTCPEPENLTSVANTATSITLGWTPGSAETNWNIEYGTTGFTPGSGITISVTTNPYEIDNLESDSTYDFYVQADCGAGDESIWVGPYTVQPGTYNMPANGIHSISGCALTIYDDGGPNSDYSSSCSSTLTINPETPGNLVAISGISSTESCCDYLRIYDGPDNTGTLLGQYQGENLTVPQLVSTTGPLTLYFYSDGSVVKSGFTLTVTCIPNTCPKPTGLTVSNVTTTSADIAWTPNGTESSWNLEYKEASATTWTSVVVTGTPSYSLSNLSVGTSHNVRVQADCSADEQSLWLEGSFTTECEVINVLPYTENFNSYTGTTYDDNNGIAPDCWITESTNTTYGAPHIIGSGSYFYASSGNSLIFTCGSAGSDAYAALPTFSAALNTLKLNFWRAMESTSSGTLTVGYVTNIADIANSFVEVATIPSVSSSNGDTISVNFATAGIPATGNICFHWNYSTSFYSCCIDDISVNLSSDTTGPGPVVTDPTVATNAASNLGQTAATLNATITNPDNVTITAKGFQWKATAGGTYATVNGTGTGNSFTAALSNLTPNTSYTFKAFITFNGTTVEGSEMTFTTLPEDTPDPCDVPTNLHTTDIQNESIAIAWDNNPNVNSWNIQYRPVGGQLASASSNTNSYTITGLTMDTQYEIQVQAVCANGTSDWSAAITAQTTNVGINSWLNNSVSLYPNPTKEYVDIRVDGDVNVKTMEVYDVYGKLINTVNVIDNPTRINVSNLANGMYFVRVTTEEGVVTKTFVKK